MILFGEYMPDRAALNNPGLLTCLNVIPDTAESYAPLKTLTAHSTNALTAYCRGAFSGVDADGEVFDFMGDETKLYQYESDGGFDDVSIAAGYTTQTDGYWNFAQYGQNIIATNFNSAIQSFVLGTSTDFAVLSADAPKAKHIAVIKDFVMVANTWDAVDDNVPHRVWWSAIDDPTSWPTPGTAAAAAVLSDYQDLPSGGTIQGLTGAVGGADGAIFMDNSIWRIQYEGMPSIFGFYEVEKAKGCPAPNSIINIGAVAFYLGEDGFNMFNGTQSIPIGQDKVDETFWADVAKDYLTRIYASYDPINNLIMWIYPGVGHSSGRPNKILIYNTNLNRWSHAEVECEMIFLAKSLGYTLDGLDAISTNLDILPFSLDSRVWMRGRLVISAFDSDHKLAAFDGVNMAAQFITGERTADKQRVFIRGIRPYVDGGTIATRIGYRDTVGGALTYTSAGAVGADGVCPHRISARYARLRMDVAVGGTWTHAQGYDQNVSEEGLR